MGKRPLEHVTDARQFADPTLLNRVLRLAEEFEDGRRRPSVAGKIMTALFYEPSTRTRLSFGSAALRLGMQVLETENAGEFSSAVKGETLEDTIKVVEGYGHVIVLRHPDDDSSARAAEVSRVPIINAGSGKAQHPTQALLDIYTIAKECGRLENLRVSFVGDLKYGRTVHSLAMLLAHFPGIRITFVSPEELRVGGEVTDYLKIRGVQFAETGSLREALNVDVVYMTRIQKERFPTPQEALPHLSAYRLDAELAKWVPGIIMHPLPRNSEIDPSVDTLRNAAYFRQAHNGVCVRMALLEMLLGS